MSTLQSRKFYFSMFFKIIQEELYRKTNQKFSIKGLHELFKLLAKVDTTRNFSREEFQDYREAIIEICILHFDFNPEIFKDIY